MNEPLKVCRDGIVSEITLSRSAKANALSSALVEGLLAAIQTATDDGTRILVLRGEGRNFCAGFDFSDLDSTTDSELFHRFVRTELMLQALYHAPFATLALCHGGVYGAGADIVAACDRRIAAPSTRFRMPGLKFGIALGTRRLAARIGADRALEIQGSARMFDAEEAMRIGFVHGVEPQERWSAILAQVVGAQKLQPAAYALLKERVQSETRDADLAALARSAGMPGLKDRIKAFRLEGE